MDKEHQMGPLEGFSDSKNVLGVEMSKAKPIGLVLTVISVPLAILFSITFISGPSFAFLILVSLSWMFAAFSLYFRVSERRAMRFHKQLQKMADESQQNSSDSSVKSVCRECHEEVSPDVKRCPNCGWKPKKRGGLWWGTTAVTSLTPIGWALGAKGASDNYKAAKGVSKEVQAKNEKPSEEAEIQSSKRDLTETLERLNELKERGVITEDEFEEKKKEILEEI